MKVFVIDNSQCVGCYDCQLGCKDEFVGNDWPPYPLAEPNTGQFWLKIREEERGTFPKVVKSYTPVLCMHCDNAPCIKAAKNGAIYKRSDGMVIIDPVKAVGQTQLVASCPYGAIYWNADLNIPQKCTACAHLLDGGWTVPRCVDNCPSGAIRFGEQADLQDVIANAQVLNPEYGTQPRVYYLNLPTPFIAGAIYDSAAEECLEGGVVTATDLKSGSVYTATTDNFGDFWLKNLEWKHTYSVTIELDGYLTKMLGAVYTGKDVNLGDMELVPSG